ncbi:GAF and ANTAR domain-containing protein [Streptomonospora nanhaiensis]|uniref:GAF domain-containing protein n=1 Tax=Streptomonospora nanhaiensis TaxID=1323731 RepID=A0A853BNM4_9ACTN|nr:GAF and ANTAR domain-containing protein [Streptomonospora nanhaiensis]MBX9391771.1 GAF and ANTAR domain-containing protein [Streptomonospora nanhaiensis]NYI96226.1 GAF domain-containing protein [Streptomonospora nanhaiensis]
MSGTMVEHGDGGEPGQEPAAPAAAGEDLAVARAFADFARDVLEKDSVPATLEEITALAVAEIDGADYAGVTLYDRRTRELSTHAPTDPLVERVDRIQYRTGQGPCLDAIWVREVFSLDSVDEETRWPEFVAEAGGLGIKSVISFQLFTHSDVLGGLNLYSGTPNAFDVTAQEIGEILAAHAAVALANARTQHHLTRAIRTRQRIGEATGILIERYKLTDRQAFTLLAKASQNLNVKLSALVEELVRTGSFPEPRELR